MGTYVYGENSAGPHAVTSAGSHTFQYDDNGNMIRKTTTSGQTTETMSIDWTSFDKPSLFTKGDIKNAFFYGPDRARYKKTVTRDGVAESVTVYIGKDYEKVTENGQDVHKYFVYAEGQLAAVHKKIGNAPGETRYMHRDSLGSIDTVTNGLGDVEEKMAYAPFGSPRSLDGQSVDFSLSFTNRGFTGHEHIDDMGIIHMNGRVYDPEIGRFMSPDTFIQDPYSSQSFNRYTYCLNNPLQYTDPSGHFFGCIVAAIVAIATNPVVVGIAAGALAGAAIGAAVGGAMAAINGGDVLEAMKGGAISGAIFGGIHFIPGMGEVGTAFSSFGQAMVHGAGGALSGAITASINGSDLDMAMVTVAIGAGVAKYVGGKFFHGKSFPKELAGRTLVGGATGGIGAEIYGGDFGNGFTNGMANAAVTAAIGFLCNDMYDELYDWGDEGIYEEVGTCGSGWNEPFVADNPSGFAFAEVMILVMAHWDG
ncbi:hypothetical protein EPICR_40132 [Candidatus Desulfarcum epimagneticum]|uniref:Teneurin-like YD-shell domain-containing protein n=1 Tax=uncultured Desulfobacteraceae bacterium TaxID=218296 RepID=A0A484HH50_9BACT|nr:hypothetical protein EPICR_40132 [uncultured Desulfobacteraceae bacterium]